MAFLAYQHFCWRRLRSRTEPILARLFNKWWWAWIYTVNVPAFGSSIFTSIVHAVFAAECIVATRAMSYCFKWTRMAQQIMYCCVILQKQYQRTLWQIDFDSASIEMPLRAFFSYTLSHLSAFFYHASVYSVGNLFEVCWIKFYQHLFRRLNRQWHTFRVGSWLLHSLTLLCSHFDTCATAIWVLCVCQVQQWRNDLWKSATTETGTSLTYTIRFTRQFKCRQKTEHQDWVK